MLLQVCSCKCSSAFASVLGAIVAKFSGGRFTESTLLVAPTECSPPALNLAKGCRARSEQRGARMISTLPKVFLRGCPAILPAWPICYTTRSLVTYFASQLHRWLTWRYSMADALWTVGLDEQYTRHALDSGPCPSRNELLSVKCNMWWTWWHKTFEPLFHFDVQNNKKVSNCKFKVRWP